MIVLTVGTVQQTPDPTAIAYAAVLSLHCCSTHTLMQPERDIELWLSTKLDDPWGSEKLSSLLNKDILHAITTRFSLLDNSIKLKVLFSFLGIRKPIMKDLAPDIKEVMDVAAADDDEWVQVMSRLFSTIADGKFNLDVKNSNFEKSLDELCTKCTLPPRAVS